MLLKQLILYQVERLYWQIGFCTAIATLLTATFFIVLDNQAPHNIHAILTLTTSISIFFTGLSLLSILYTKHFLAKCTGFFLILFSGWTILEPSMTKEPEESVFFLFPSIHPIIGFVPFLFLILGMIFLLWKNKWIYFQSTGRFFCALVIILISFTGFISHLFNQNIPHVINYSLFTDLYTPFLLFLIGVSLIFTSLYDDAKNQIAIERHLPILITTLVMFFMIIFFFEIVETRKHLSQAKTWIYLIFFGMISLGIGILYALLKKSQKHVLAVKDLQKQLEDKQFNLSTSIQGAGIGTWMWDVINERLFLDRQAHALLGLGVMSSSGTLKDFLTEPSAQNTYSLESLMKNLIIDFKKKVIKFEMQILSPNYTVRYVAAKGKVFQDRESKSINVFGSFWDITSVKLLTQGLKVSHDVIRVLSDATTLKEACAKILVNLHHSFGTEVIVIWKWDQKIASLQCIEIAYAPSVEQVILHPSNQQLIGKDLTIPNHVVETFRPFYVRDLTELIVQNLETGPSDRMQSVIAFPILHGTALAGVIELFKKSAYLIELDEDLANQFTTIGIALGQFIQRIDAKQAEEQLVSIVTHSANAFFLVDTDGFIRSWNIGAEKMFGYKPDEVIGKLATILIFPSEHTLYESIHSKILSGETIHHTHMRGIKKDGQLTWIQGSISPITDDHKKIIYGSVMLEDISKEIEGNLNLLRSQEKLRAIIEITEEWFWEMNVSRTFTYSSRIVEQILGYHERELLGKDLLLFLFDEERQEVEEEFKKNIETKRGWRKRLLRWKHKDGFERWLECNSEPSFNENGEVIGFYGASRDITQSLYMEQMKKEFISLVSHELRTPLTSIHGALGLLVKNGALSDDKKELLTIAYRNSNRLKKLINDLLDIQKVQFEKFSFPLQPISLENAIQESIDSEIHVAESEHKKLIIEKPLPHILVNADHERIIQVMSNLVSNALKFSPPESIVTISHHIQDNWVRIAVQDQGIGIAKEFQPKVFTRFARAETGDSRATPGTGLGLSIAKSIIEQCGGKIGFESEEGKGTTFYFELPIIIKEGKE